MLDGIKDSGTQRRATRSTPTRSRTRPPTSPPSSLTVRTRAGEKAGVVAESKAREAALQAKDSGKTPKVEAFVEWVTPRIEQAWNESVKAAAPRVEKWLPRKAPP